MNILFLSAEVAPFSTVGGLSQVSYFLPRALLKLGHDVRIFSAKYGRIDGSGGSLPVKKKWPMKLEAEGLAVPIEARSSERVADNTSHPPPAIGHELFCNLKSSRAGRFDPPVYFLENREYYELRANVYGYSDDHIRFGLLSKGCLEWLLQIFQKIQKTLNTGKSEQPENQKTGNSGSPNLRVSDTSGSLPSRQAGPSFPSVPNGDSWFPDVIHCNDWHTAAVAELIKTSPRYAPIKNIPVLLTVHNFGHQGNPAFDHRFLPPDQRDRGDDPLPGLLDPKLITKNILVRGIKYADSINTVSKTHAEEVLTPEYGEGIEDVLIQYQDKLTGILNGLDTKEFNPLTDPNIKSHYSVKSINRRAENKIALQREFKLPKNPQISLLAISGRMDRQKGLDLVVETLPKLLANFDFQLVVLGGGDQNFRQLFLNFSTEYPNRVAVYLRPSFSLPHKIFAGADILLMPSKFEPGGIAVLEALRYGCVPLVRRTGGLNDIVEDFDPSTKTGNGFSFTLYDPWAFYGAAVAALTTYREPDSWRRLVQNCLRSDFSWDRAAREYDELYHSLLK
jgi:starch synthase